jgi:CheY-like chemotaxis protein
MVGPDWGLTISTCLAQMMKGRIWVESAAGKGSTFHFTARFGVQKNARPKLALAELAKLRGLSILVVDDNETNRRILQEMLVGWGMTPTLCESGKKALALLRDSKSRGTNFALMLLDGCMPEMDGFALAKVPQDDPYLPKPLTVMLTSGGLRGDAARCREVGIRGYLPKPIRGTELLEVIQIMLGKEVPENNESLITQHSLQKIVRD